MPFAEPETTLAATIDAGGDLTFIRGETTRPEAGARPSTTFQPLTRKLSDLQRLVIDSLGILSKAKRLCTLPAA